MSDQERKDFEVWCKRIGFTTLRNYEGDYVRGYGAELWSGWQARAALAQQAVPTDEQIEARAQQLLGEWMRKGSEMSGRVKPRPLVNDASAQQAVPEGHIAVPVNVLNDASRALGNFVSDHGWSDADMQAMDNLDAYLAPPAVQSMLAAAPAAPQSEQQDTQAPAPAPEPSAWVPYLSDRADGVAGHYAIARWNPAGYREVWNLRSHRWASASDDVMSLEEADSLLRQIVIPTVKPAPVAQAFTEGHCTEKRKPGGCQLHNLHCGYPACDRKPVTSSPFAPGAEPVARATEFVGAVRIEAECLPHTGAPMKIGDMLYAAPGQAPAPAPDGLTSEQLDGIRQALLDTAKDPHDIDEADRIVERILSSFKPATQAPAVGDRDV